MTPRSGPHPSSAPAGEGGSRAERENLPDEVEPGVTYRNVRVGWRAGAALRHDEDADEPESAS